MWDGDGSPAGSCLGRRIWLGYVDEGVPSLHLEDRLLPHNRGKLVLLSLVATVLALLLFLFIPFSRVFMVRPAVISSPPVLYGSHRLFSPLFAVL